MTAFIIALSFIIYKFYSIFDSNVIKYNIDLFNNLIIISRIDPPNLIILFLTNELITIRILFRVNLLLFFINIYIRSACSSILYN